MIRKSSLSTECKTFCSIPCLNVLDAASGFNIYAIINRVVISYDKFTGGYDEMFSGHLISNSGLKKLAVLNV